MLMAMTRTLLRSKTRSFVRPSPVDILGSVNDEMYDDFTEIGMFATVFVGQYDHAEKILYYANAGHSPVIFCPAGGEATLLEADGAPLGVLPNSTCENQAIYFNPGDVHSCLLLYIKSLGYRQVGKAVDFDSTIRRFKSSYPIQFRQ